MGDPSFEPDQKPDERSAHELSSCLLELSRLVRGVAFYPAGDAHRRELLDRTATAFESELARCGELQLAADGLRIEIAGLEDPPTGAHVEHLARAIAEQQIAGLSFAPGLERDAIEGLALLLAREPTELDAAAAFEPWDDQGIAVISSAMLDPTPAAVDAPAAPPPPMERTARPDATVPAREPTQTGEPPAAGRRLTSDDAILDALAGSGASDADERAVPAAAVAAPPVVSGGMPDLDAPAAPRPLDETDPLLQLAAEGPVPETDDPTAELADDPDEPTAPFRSDADTTEDTETLEAGADATDTTDTAPAVVGGDRRPELDVPARTLQAWLRRLADARDEEAYADACAEALEAADLLLGSGRPDEAYAAVLTFTEHASGASGLDAGVRANAHASLRELCDGEMLQYTISRACSHPDPQAEVRAAQVLLQLGEPAVPGVLERLRVAREPERLAQLSAVVIALGDGAVGPLSDELERGGSQPSRVAIQLAGELQNPRLVAPLARVLHEGDPSRRSDAARSLVTIGRAAGPVFVEGLTSGDAALARLCMQCLGRLRDRRAGRALLAALDRAVRERDDAATRDAMRALRELGDPAAVGPLAEIAGRRDWLRRSKQKDVRLAAVAALERIDDAAAARALEQLARTADAPIARRAREVLDRRRGRPVADAG